MSTRSESSDWTYEQAIADAINELKDRKGSSSYAIRSHIEANMPKGITFDDNVYRGTLSDMVTDGDLSFEHLRYTLFSSKKCGACGLYKDREGFDALQWAEKKVVRRGCLLCIEGESDHKRCRGCSTAKTREKYCEAAWEGEKQPLCRKCDELHWAASALGVLCPLTSWTKLMTGELPEKIECPRCDGSGYYQSYGYGSDSDGYYGYSNYSNMEECHECHGSGNSHLPVDDDIAVSLREEKPTKYELTATKGEYEVIFSSGPKLMGVKKKKNPLPTDRSRFVYSFLSRNANGSLSFRVDGNGCLHGTIKMKKGHGFHILVDTESRSGSSGRVLHKLQRDNRDIYFEECTDAEKNAFSAESMRDTMRTKFLRMESNALAIKANYGGNGLPTNTVTGMIQIVSKRVALPICKDMRQESKLRKHLPALISVEEGEALLESYKKVGSSWLCTKLGLPGDVARAVRHFLRPEPVFFLEPGDVWIRNVSISKSKKGITPYQPTLLVARRKKETRD